MNLIKMTRFFILILYICTGALLGFLITYKIRGLEFAFWILYRFVYLLIRFCWYWSYILIVGIVVVDSALDCHIWYYQFHITGKMKKIGKKGVRIAYVYLRRKLTRRSSVTVREWSYWRFARDHWPASGADSVVSREIEAFCGSQIAAARTC